VPGPCHGTFSSIPDPRRSGSSATARWWMDGGRGPAGSCRRGARTGLPAPPREVGNRMVEGLAARIRIVFLRIVGAGSDHVVGVTAGAQDDLGHLIGGDLAAGLDRKVDQSLRLVLRRMRLRVGLQYGARGFVRLGQRDPIFRLGAAEHPGYDRVLALVDRARRGLAAHRAIDCLDGELGRKARHIGLPGADLALSRDGLEKARWTAWLTA